MTTGPIWPEEFGCNWLVFSISSDGHSNILMRLRDRLKSLTIVHHFAPPRLVIDVLMVSRRNRASCSRYGNIRVSAPMHWPSKGSDAVIWLRALRCPGG